MANISSESSGSKSLTGHRRIIDWMLHDAPKTELLWHGSMPCPEAEGPASCIWEVRLWLSVSLPRLERWWWTSGGVGLFGDIDLRFSGWNLVGCLLDFGVFCIERLMLNIKLLGCFMVFPGKEGCHLSLQNRLQARSLSTNCSIFPSTWAPAH